MEDHQEAMVKSLVAVAWADGRVDAGESEVIEALISAFRLSEEDSEAIRVYSREPRSLEEVPLTELSTHDRRMLLQHAVVLSYVDGEQSSEERVILEELVRKLNIPGEEAAKLIDSSEQRARRLLEWL
ncbi:MAG: DUF533 domain-containing protein [Myxococcota bacterium]